MAKTVDIAAEREKRAERCSFCGELAHPGELMCRRIDYITLSPDGTVEEIHLIPPWEFEDIEDGEPPPAA